MKIEEDTITFNSGHKAHATLGIVGINSQLELSEGYDRHIDWPVPEWWQKQHPERTLTNEDMRELADHMIGLLSFRSVPMEIPASSQPITAVPKRTSAPSCSRARCAERESDSSN